MVSLILQLADKQNILKQAELRITNITNYTFVAADAYGTSPGAAAKSQKRGPSTLKLLVPVQ